jgi:two-component system LytT family response regulator
MDYLLKPFDKKRFSDALERAKKYVQNTTETTLKSSIEQLLNHHRSNHGFLSKVMVKTTSRVFFLNVDVIDWIEASGNYVRIHSGEKSYLIRGTMNSMERKLDPALFIRIHRSFIVNVDSIKELESWFHGDYKVVLKNGKELVLSRNYRRLLQQFN